MSLWRGWRHKAGYRLVWGPFAPRQYRLRYGRPCKHIGMGAKFVAQQLNPCSANKAERELSAAACKQRRCRTNCRHYRKTPPSGLRSYISATAGLLACGSLRRSGNLPRRFKPSGLVGKTTHPQQTPYRLSAYSCGGSHGLRFGLSAPPAPYSLFIFRSGKTVAHCLCRGQVGVNAG